MANHLTEAQRRLLTALAIEGTELWLSRNHLGSYEYRLELQRGPLKQIGVEIVDSAWSNGWVDHTVGRGLHITDAGRRALEAVNG